MLSIPEAVDTHADAAAHKVDLLRNPALFLVRTMLAGAFIGIGVLVMVEVGGPLAAAGSPFTPLAQGLVFGIALTIVVVAGAELATSAMMILTQGAIRGAIGWARAAVTLLACMAGNLLGAVVFAALVHASGVVAPGTPAGTQLAAMIEHKAHATTGQLFVRGILCNLLVCLAIWCGARLRSESARIILVFSCVLVFIASGFEHSIANMTTFSLGLMDGLPGATIGEFARNVAAVGLGNIVGGGLLVGAAYAYRGRVTNDDAPAPGTQADDAQIAALQAAARRATASRTPDVPALAPADLAPQTPSSWATTSAAPATTAH
ncbi:formate/nitrite transporter family protein [Cellulomonas alba]|uniref:Formate/nitrite transporter family protein n=1 Tax=Cellulomonas alba TaxID=3053467 RepID=A0ABT7SG41_9CELL|nr:formate/nitrite transporter family protein [Cellulomonas alba]MDM7854474.1 formate/nitrite transporter family protein [Cellulomonas alba]